MTQTPAQLHRARSRDRARWDSRHRTARRTFKIFDVGAVLLLVLGLALGWLIALGHVSISWVVPVMLMLMSLVFLLGRQMVGRWVTVVSWRDRLIVRFVRFYRGRRVGAAVNKHGIPSARAQRREVNKAAWRLARQRSRG